MGLQAEAVEGIRIVRRGRWGDVARAVVAGVGVKGKLLANLAEEYRAFGGLGWGRLGRRWFDHKRPGEQCAGGARGGDEM